MDMPVGVGQGAGDEGALEGIFGGRYNDAVRDFNSGVQQFPNNLMAGAFGFEPREYFEADAQALEVPTVQF